MWFPDPDRVVKVVLHDRGDDVEAPWAEDLGPDPADPARRLVKIGNVPVFHAKPTYEDVVSVGKDPAYPHLAWDRGGVGFAEIGRRIHADSGRWAMIVDYRLREGDTDLAAAFRAMDLAGERAEIAVGGAYADGDGRGGRAYAAVPRGTGVKEALAALAAADPPMDLTLVHPVEDPE